MNFLKFTSELFGDFVAERPIQIFDFDTKKEQITLQNSRLQYLPFRDRSGRRVFVGVGVDAPIINNRPTLMMPSWPFFSILSDMKKHQIATFLVPFFDENRPLFCSNIAL